MRLALLLAVVSLSGCIGFTHHGACRTVAVWPLACYRGSQCQDGRSFHAPQIGACE